MDLLGLDDFPPFDLPDHVPDMSPNSYPYCLSHDPLPSSPPPLVPSSPPPVDDISTLRSSYAAKKRQLARKAYLARKSRAQKKSTMDTLKQENKDLRATISMLEERARQWKEQDRQKEVNHTIKCDHMEVMARAPFVSELCKPRSLLFGLFVRLMSRACEEYTKIVTYHMKDYTHTWALLYVNFHTRATREYSKETIQFTLSNILPMVEETDCFERDIHDAIEKGFTQVEKVRLDLWVMEGSISW